MENTDRDERYENITGYYKNEKLVIGTNVTKIGQTTKTTQGKILSTDAIGAYNLEILNTRYTFEDTVKISNETIEGDSGGPVFHQFIGPLGVGEICPITMVGITSFRDSNNNGYIIKIQNILDKFNLSLYKLDIK